MFLVKQNIFLFIIVFTISSVLSQICLDERLLETYKQKNCQPIRSEKNAKCPQVYECPKPLASAKQGCVYENKNYKIGEPVVKTNPCAICNCGFDNIVSCVYSECPDDAFGVPPYPSNATEAEIKGKYKNCYYAYEVNKCCGTPVCHSDDELSKMHQCTYDGRQYKLGEKIYPKDVCKTCVCTKEFDEKNLDNSACRKVECDINMKKIKKGCVAVSHEAHCCPIQYKCPLPNWEEKQKICELPSEAGPCDETEERYFYNKAKKQCEKFTYSGCLGNKNNFKTNEECLTYCTSPKPSEVRDVKKCYFGEKGFSVGTKLTTSDTCLECLCLIPPDITCVNRC